MRVVRVPAATVAVVGLVLVTGCRVDGLEVEPSPPAGSAGAAAKPSHGPARPGRETAGATPSAAQVRRVLDAPEAGGLVKAAGRSAAGDIDPGEIRDGMTLVVNRYARSDARGRRADVLVVAVDHVPEPTTRRREHLWRGMLDHIAWGYDMGGPEAEPVADPGPLGGSVECALASLAEDGDVVCGWADATTAGVAHFPNSTLPEAAARFVAMRGDLEK